MDPLVSQMKSGEHGLGRVIAAAGHSWRGLIACWRNEAAFRQEVLLVTPLLLAAVILDVSSVARALLMASVLLVLIVELLNSGIEAAIDRIGTDHHPLSGLAKDVASAAVLLSLLLAILVWACILL